MNDLLSQLSTYGYIILFLYSMGGGFFALVAAAMLSFSGKMDLALSIAVAGVANFLGDTFLFYFGRNYKKEVAGYVKKYRRKVAYAYILIKRYGNFVVVIQKFLYGFKTIVPIAMGFSKYDFKKFTIINLASSVLWSVFFGLLGFLGGSALEKIFAELYQKTYYLAIIAALAAAIIWILLRLTNAKRTNIS